MEETKKCCFPMCGLDGVIGLAGEPKSCSKHDAERKELMSVLSVTEPISRSMEYAEGKTYWVWGGMAEAGEDLGFFQKGDIVGIGAYSGQGKTTFTTQLALKLAGGDSFLGYACPTPMKTLIISESPKKQLGLEVKWSGVEKEVADKIIVTYLPMISAPAVEMLIDRYRPDKLDLDTMTSIIPTLGLHGPGVFDWNNPTHVSAVMNFLDTMRRRYSLKLILCLAHTTKADLKKRLNPSAALAAFAGTQALVTRFEAAYLIRRIEGSDDCELYRAKSRFTHETVERIIYSYNKTTHQIEAASDDISAMLVVTNEDRARIGVRILKEAGVPMSMNRVVARLREKSIGTNNNDRAAVRELMLQTTLCDLEEGYVAEEDGKMSWRGNKDA